MKMKKLLAMLLCAILVFSVVAFAACGEPENPGPQGPGGGDGKYSATEAQGRQVVKVGFGEAGYGSATIRALTKSFNETNATYFIDLTVAPAAEFCTTAEQDLNNDTPKMDLYFLSEIYWKHMALKGYFVDLQEVYDAPFNSNMTIGEAMYEDSRENCYALGADKKKHFYSINASASTSSIIVNMDVANFYENSGKWSGAKKISQVKTVAELNQWVQKIQNLSKTMPYTYADGNGKGEVKGWVYPGQYMQYWDFVVDAWWAQYEGIDNYHAFYEMAEPAVFNQTGRLKALQAFESLKLEQNALECAADDHIKSQQKFISGRAALIPNGSWISYESKGVIEEYGANIKMIYVPMVEKGVQDKYISNSASGLTCISHKSTEGAIKGAKEFLKYYFREENYPRMFTKETGSLAGFDGHDGEASYVDAIWDDLNVFAQDAIALVTGANALVSNRPNDFDAPNYMMLSAGVTSAWPGGRQYLGLINSTDEVTAQTVFQESITIAQNEWTIWLQKIA